MNLPPGWVLTTTGGGCTALEYTWPDGTYALVTVPEEAAAPDTETAPCWLGLYDADGHPRTDDLYAFQTVLEAFQALEIIHDCYREEE